MSCVDGSRVARVLFRDDAVVGCSLVSGLFVRRCYLAAGHNALRGSGSDQKHAVSSLHWLKWSVLIFGATGWVHYSSIALSNFVSAGRARACFNRPVLQAPGNRCHAPSSPRRCGRSCWPARWRRPSSSGVVITWSARAGAYNQPAGRAGSRRARRPRATFAGNGCPPWRCARDAPCRRSSSASAPTRSTPPDHAPSDARWRKS